ncbi:MAG: helix-turn-helix domain-containing protein [Caldilineaceae bacterium]|nr:TetR/AcrR family transcriptional regulator [Caldilineaceae bacterium]
MTEPIDEPISKGDRTRAALIDSAYEQFTQRGYHGASMRAIAEGAGLAVGGIYNHFASKDAVFEAVIIAHHPLMKIMPQLTSLEGDTLADLLRSAINRAGAELDAQPRIFNLLMIELIECEGRHVPVLAEKLLPRLAGFIALIQGRSNELRAMPDMAFAQLFVGTLFAHWFTSRLLIQAGVPSPALADADLFIDVLLHGVQHK